jgi:signal transduction histidine kinase
MLPRSISISVQLLLMLVGLVAVTTVGLTTSAYRSFHTSLENEARRQTRTASGQMAESITRLLEAKTARAADFVKTLGSLCRVADSSGPDGWDAECTRRALAEFRSAERARGVLFEYRRQFSARAGDPPRSDLRVPGSFVRIVSRHDGFDYLLSSSAGGSTLTAQFPMDDLESAIRDHAVLGSDGEVFLTDTKGRFLTMPRDAGPSRPPAGTDADPVSSCLEGPAEVTAIDYRGIPSIHALRPVPLFLDSVCVDAHLPYEEALAPAETLVNELILRGALFALLGIAMSLLAAQWIGKPIRRLAQSVHAVQDGHLDHPFVASGPSEIRALARGCAKMAEAIGLMVSREQTARREAEAANTTKDEFLATVSHELRTPLTAILGWAQMFRHRRLVGDSADRAMSAIERAAHAQSRLVEDLLDLSRIESGRLAIHRSAVSLAASTETVLESVRPAAERKDIALEYAVEGPIPPVLGDEERLQQIVSNLVGNAIKFTPPAGHINVSLRSVSGLVELSVADTGEGIAPEFLPHVFERFQQASAARGGGASGLGIGLAIVEHLVKAHDGAIHVTSEGPGRGSTFTVTMPACDN